MLIKAASLPDIASIQYVARETWRHTYENIIPVHVQDSFLEYAYSDDMMEQRIKRGNFYIASCNDEVIGFINFKNGQKEAELLAIYVHPKYQRKEVGSGLLNVMLKNIDVNTDIICDVESDNERGKSFYRKKGFIEETTYDDDFLGHKLSTTKMRLIRK